MGKLYNSGSPTSKVYNVSLNAPFDTRLTVQNVADLTDGENGGIASLVYRGMVVYVHQDKSLYIYTGASNGTWKNKNTGKLINGGDINNWKKLIVDPVDALEFYEGIFTKKEELADFLTSSDLEDYVKVEDIADVTSGFVTESDLDVYVKTTDLVDFVKSEDIKDFAKKEDLVDFLTASDVNEFVRLNEIHKIISEEVVDKFVSQSDLEVYVKTEELADFVTSSELDARIAAIDIPEVPKNVSEFRNDAGYLTESTLPDFLTASDVEDFISVDELNNVLADYASQSDLKTYVKIEDVINYIEQNGDFVKSDEIKNFLEASDLADFITVNQVNEILIEKGIDDFVSQSDLTVYVNRSELVNYVTSSELNNYAPLKSIPTKGMFPAESDVDITETVVDGYATVQDVMDYVNALIEKKKDELVPSGEVKDYLYVNGVSYTDDNVLPTPGTIYDMNCYEISDVLISDGLKVYVGPEILGFNEGDPTTTIYSEVFSVDVPTGYSIEVHNWDSDNNKWFDAVLPMMSNPKQATKLYGGKTYNCFVRTLDDNFNDARTVSVRYKIIINKNQ